MKDMNYNMKGICLNIDSCELAYNKIIQEAEKANFVCAECGSPLIQK